METQKAAVTNRGRQHHRFNSLFGRRFVGVAAPLLLFGIALLLLTWPVAAAEPTTDVSGNIDTPTTWTLAGSPYIVTGNIVVRNGGVLTIEPGVEVRFNANTTLRVLDGRLEATGSAANPIVFTANTGSPARDFWDGLAYDDISQANTLSYCVIEYAARGVSVGDSDSHLITHCTFRHNGDGGDLSSGGAINSEGDYLTITDNEIHDNELGMRLRKSNNNLIERNTIHNNDNFGIGLVVQGGSGGNNNEIIDNLIESNGDDGLQLDDGFNNQVLRNQIVGNGGHGIWVSSQSIVQIIDNIVRSNGQNGLTYAEANFLPADIHSNVFCNNIGFDLQNLWGTSITAAGNWFGTNTPGPAQVDGLVVYSPWIEVDVELVPDTLPADGTSEADFNISMVDGTGHDVPDGYEVSVAATEGSLSDTTLTLIDGQATTTYTAGVVPGNVGFEVADQCTDLYFPGELTLENCMDLSVSKDDGDGLVPWPWPDKEYLITYTLTYTNEGCYQASGVVLTDTLPAGTQFHTGTDWACDSGVCTYQIGSLPVNGPQTAPPLVVEVLPSALVDCSDLENKADISDDGASGPDIDPDDNTYTLNTAIPCQPDLVLTKDDGVSDCVQVGDRITYTLTYTNVGFADASNVFLAETVPDYTSYVGSGWACAVDTCTLDVGSVGKGEHGSAEFVVQVDEPPPGGEVVNNASISSTETDVDPRDNDAQETTAICELLADLQISKTASDLIIGPNKEHFVDYTITVTNTGEVDLAGIVVTDTLPTGTAYAGTGWTCDSTECTYDVGDLAFGDTVELTLRVSLDHSELDCPISLTNVVQVADDGSQGPDRTPGDNEFTLNSTFECLPDLVVVVNDNVGPEPDASDAWLEELVSPFPSAPDQRLCVEVGDWITYTIAYVNAGPATATQVVLTETVPEHTSYVGFDWDCVGDTCTRSIGTLAPGEGGVVDFIVRVDTAPPDLIVEDEVRIGGAEEDLYPPDNVSNDDTPICQPAPLLISKDDNLPCAFPGDEIRYTIVFTNPFGEALSGVVLTETLPANTTYLASSGWVAVGGGQYVYDYGSLPAYASDSVEFAVLVDDPLPDTVVETVDVVCIGYEGPGWTGNCYELVTPLPLAADLRVVKHDHVGPPPEPDTVQELKRLYQLMDKPGYRLPAVTQDWEPVRPGDIYSYTITYLNMGRTPATGVVLTETLPENTSYVGYGWTHVGGRTYTYQVGDLNVREGGQRNFWVQVEPVPCENEGYLYNWVHIGGNEEECNLANNWSGEETPVECWEYGLYLPLILRNVIVDDGPTPTPSPTPSPTPDPDVAYVKDVAVNPVTDRVYVSSPAMDSVLAVDPSGSGSVLTSIPVGDDPIGVAVVTTTNKIYAANFHSWTVTAIRGSDHTPIGDQYVGAQACKVTADSADGRVYVTNHLESENGAAAINSQTDAFEYYYHRMHATSGRYGIDVDPDADKLFIASRNGGLIAIQDAYAPGQEPQLVKLEPARVPYVVAFNPTTKHLYVTAADDNVVVVLAPYDIQWNRGRWVTWRGRRVLVLDEANAGWIKEIGVGQGAEEGIAINPDTGRVYVTNADSNTVSIIQDDANAANIQWLQDVAVGDYPQGVDVDATRNLVYIANAQSRDLTVINGADNTILKTIPLE